MISSLKSVGIFLLTSMRVQSSPKGQKQSRSLRQTVKVQTGFEVFQRC